MKLVPKFDDIHVDDDWFQQDDAMPYDSSILHETFCGCILSYYSDLTLLNLFLWNYLKSKVYAKPTNSQAHMH